MTQIRFSDSVIVTRDTRRAHLKRYLRAWWNYLTRKKCRCGKRMARPTWRGTEYVYIDVESQSLLVKSLADAIDQEILNNYKEYTRRPNDE